MYLGMVLLKKCFLFKIDAKIQIISYKILVYDYKMEYFCNDYRIKQYKITTNINQ